MTKKGNPVQTKTTAASKPVIHPLQSITRQHFFYFGCLLVTLVCYVPALHNGWTNWDDNVYVYENDLTQNLSFHNLYLFFTTYQVGNYHPLTMLSLAFDYKLFGMDATGFHVHSVLLHLLNVTLVFVFTWMLCGEIRVAFITAICFGLHPANVESVAWISERKDLLYVFYYLLALIFYLQYLWKGEAQQQASRNKFYLLALLFFFLSVLSKGQAVTLPVALLLIDYFLSRPVNRKIAIEKIPFFLLSFGFGIAALLAQKSAKAFTDVSRYTFPERLLFSVNSLLTYLFKTIIPIHLSAFYPYPLKINGNYAWFIYASPVLLLILIIVLLYFFRRNRTVMFGLAFFVLNLLLVLQVIPVGGAIMADRYTYLAHVGLFFLMGVLVSRMVKKKQGWQKIFSISTIVILLIYWGLQTVAQGEIWNSSETLYLNMLHNYPYLPSAKANLGLYYEGKGEPGRAMQCYVEAIAMDPKFTPAYGDRANLYIQQEKYDSALIDYNKLLDLDPGNASAYMLRSQANESKGNLQMALLDAKKAFDIGIKNDKARSRLYSTIADAYVGLQLYASGDSCYEIALQFFPGNFEALNNYAYNLSLRGEKLEMAATLSQRAMKIDSANGTFMDTYAWVLFKQKKFNEARIWMERALKKKGEDTPDALSHYQSILDSLK